MTDTEKPVEEVEAEGEADNAGDAGDAGGAGGADPAMMAKLMESLKGAGGGGDGGMDMAALQSMLGGMGGGGGGGMDMASMLGGMGGMGGADNPEMQARQQAQRNQADSASKNEGEKDGGTSDGAAYKWEQTSKYGDSEVIVRFPLDTPATKKDVKVAFKAKELKVVVGGTTLLEGKTFGATHPDDSTWCLVEKGAELQVMLALAEDTKWHELMAA